LAATPLKERQYRAAARAPNNTASKILIWHSKTVFLVLEGTEGSKGSVYLHPG